jgi:gamma-glutamyl phosphate reductase
MCALASSKGMTMHIMGSLQRHQKDITHIVNGIGFIARLKNPIKPVLILKTG